MGTGLHQGSGYAPYALKICLNGHEWVKRQLRRHRVAFTALDNGVPRCGAPAGLRAICDRLTEADIEAFFTRWAARLPLPLTAAHQAAGFRYRLSILQMEVSRTQVFDRPLRGREFFGQHINGRLLEAEQTAHDCGLAGPPGRTRPAHADAGRPAGPGLEVRPPPRVTALLGALCLFACAPEGITNGRLRPVVAQLLGDPDAQYTARQMGDDLRRLARKGLLRRVPAKLCYTLTPAGRRTALFLTKVHARVIRPGLQALDTRIAAQVPPTLRAVFAALDAATDSLIEEARLAA